MPYSCILNNNGYHLFHPRIFRMRIVTAMAVTIDDSTGRTKSKNPSNRTSLSSNFVFTHEFRHFLFLFFILFFLLLSVRPGAPLSHSSSSASSQCFQCVTCPYAVTLVAPFAHATYFLVGLLSSIPLKYRKTLS